MTTPDDRPPHDGPADDRHRDDAPTDDEVVSAVLDGEATPEEVARVEADPVLRARLAAFRSAAAAVGAPVTPADPAARDAAVAAALAAADELADREASGGAVDELAARRTSRPPGRTGTWLAAAAVLAVLVGLGALLVGRSGDEPFETAGRAVGGDAAEEQTAADQAPDVASEGAEGDAAPGAGPPTTAAPLAAPDAGFDTGANAASRSASPVPLLDPAGDLADDDAVARWATAVAGTGSAELLDVDPAADTAAPTCSPTAGAAVAVAFGTYAGRDVQLVVVDTGAAEGGDVTGALAVEVVDPERCEVLSVVEVPAG